MSFNSLLTLYCDWRGFELMRNGHIAGCQISNRFETLREAWLWPGGRDLLKVLVQLGRFIPRFR